MRIYLSQILLALTIAFVNGAKVHDEVKKIRKAAEHINAANKAITQKIKSMNGVKTKIGHLEEVASRDMKDVIAEQKIIAEQETSINEKINLLNELKNIQVTSSEGLSDMIKKEQKELRENELKIVPTRESLRKSMDTIKFLRRNKLDSAEALGSDIEKRTSDMKMRKNRLKRNFNDLDQRIAFGIPADV